ncbi:MAG: sulfurtransferase-like selenium metabolism protein YedF [bacterium]|jgi:selenium metabolism protein YedF
MEERRVDARGLACPLPVIETKKAIEGLRCGKVITLVDNAVARDNVTKLAASLNLPVDIVAAGNDFILTITKEGALVEARAAESTAPVASPERLDKGPVILILSDSIGRPAEELGQVLMRSFFYTLTESTPAPECIILMNGGVRLACSGADTLPSLKTLEKQGVEILACGTCLDYLGLKDSLEAGTVSNMYTIVERILAAPKTITVS